MQGYSDFLEKSWLWVMVFYLFACQVICYCILGIVGDTLYRLIGYSFSYLKTKKIIYTFLF